MTITTQNKEKTVLGAPQISLRDWFAGQALAGEVQFDATRSPANIARDAYLTADAMLAARENGGDA